MKKKLGIYCDVGEHEIGTEVEYRHFGKHTQDIKGNWIDIDICGDCWENMTAEDLFDLLGGECLETGSYEWLERMIYGTRGELTI